MSSAVESEGAGLELSEHRENMRYQIRVGQRFVATVLSRTLGGRIMESEVAGLLEATEKAHRGCQIGSYPFFRDGRAGANFVIRSDDEAVLKACAVELLTGLQALGKDVVDGGIW